LFQNYQEMPWVRSKRIFCVKPIAPSIQITIEVKFNEPQKSPVSKQGFFLFLSTT